jgi:hypothetical protein
LEAREWADIPQSTHHVCASSSVIAKRKPMEAMKLVEETEAEATTEGLHRSKSCRDSKKKRHRSRKKTPEDPMWTDPAFTQYGRSGFAMVLQQKQEMRKKGLIY